MKKTEDDIVNEPEVENEDTGSHSLMEKPFNPKLIDIKQKNLSIDIIIKRLTANEIDLYPEFQRKDDLWDNERQSQLIESILINFPLPAFYFDGTDNNKWLIVDGLQRLSTLRNFIVKKNDSLVLTGLEFLKQLEGEKFVGLSRTLQRQIEETQIVAYIINPGTPPEVKFNIFKRINTGGLILTPQEIRHALNQGIPSKFISELANSDPFKSATHHKIKTERMLDQEFITRFVAFYIKPIKNYIPDLDTYLNENMGELKSLSGEEREKMKSNFHDAMHTIKSVFGKWTFRKVYTDSITERLKPINKALFEVWSVEVAKLSKSQKQIFKNKGKEVFNEFMKLMNSDQKFVDSITTTTGDKTRVLYRFNTIENLIKNVIGK